MKIFAGLWLMAAYGLLLLPVAQAEPTEHFKEWVQDCSKQADGKRACHIFQNVTDHNTGEVMLRAEVGYIPGGNKALLLITVPLGVALRTGLELQIDSAKPRRMLFDVCARDGCRAATQMDVGLIRAMKRGGVARVTISNLAGRSLVVPVSLSGFTKGLGSLSP